MTADWFLDDEDIHPLVYISADRVQSTEAAARKEVVTMQARNSALHEQLDPSFNMKCKTNSMLHRSMNETEDQLKSSV